ncbi:hypothetical protein Btru_004483 [Bulinus truncatus]|nr:hypothetical protein Btru_004483 [Bulinus truncatus]
MLVASLNLSEPFTPLLVGAPRSNDSSLPDVHEPGAVFQCNWQYRSSCQPVFVDNIANEKQTLSKWKNTTVHHFKNNQWLGTSIDVNVNGDFRVMICAPRWINQKHSVQGLQFMNGICYESGKDLQFNETSVRPVLEHFKKQIHVTGAYQVYGMGSLGSSSAYSKDGSFAIIGAPGINDWAGGYAQIERQYPTRPQIREMSYETDKDSYFATEVYAYNSNFKLILVKEGDQLGSSFGSSLCAADANGDSLDDLTFNLELETNLLSGSNTVGGRFGTAVANLGDLNLDHFEDIAVGAPYEEDSGVVYIFNGAKNGLNSAPSQRIVGKAIDNDLKTFGWSFSRPWDVDSNHYGDFAVGAFQSNKVVLLRTRSVVDLNASLETSSNIVNLKNRTNCMHKGRPYRCIEVSVCLQYSGKNLPPSSDVNVTLKLDTLERHRGEQSRLFMQGPGYTEIDSLTTIITIRLEKRMCPEKYIIYTRESRDVFTPLRIDLNYEIASSSIGIASDCTICPVRNIYNPINTFIMAYYSLDCKEDHSCQPELTIVAVPLFRENGQTLVIDDSPYFDLEITLTNEGEISYLTMVTIDYPLYLHYTNTRVKHGGYAVTCVSTPGAYNTSKNSINCDIFNPLRNSDKVVLSSRFYAQSIPYDVTNLILNVSATTVNRRVGQTIAQKDTSVSIPVQISSELKLYGSSLPGYLRIPRISHSSLFWETVSHIYIISNLGPSPMPHGQLIFLVPTNNWLKITNVDLKSLEKVSHVPVECNMSEQSMETNITYSYGDEGTQAPLLTCEASACTSVTCYVGTMYKYQSIHINISLSIRKDGLQIAKIDDKLTLITTCQFQEPDYMAFTSLATVFNATIMTFIGYKSPIGQPISWWALIISIASGVLLLYILVVLLWKCGFFKRKQKEELQKLIQYFEFEREIHSDSGSARSSDLMILPPGLIPVEANHNCLHQPDSPVFLPTNDGPFNLGDNYFFSHSLNRRQNTAEPPSTFRTLQYHNNNKPLLPTPRNHHRRRDGSHNSHRKPAPNLNFSQRQNIWLAPVVSAPPPPPPSFNNDLYLEPLESRA